eukprot:scaffold32871_cov63-Phaeocystis_antarctica.AAC.2
MTAQRIAGGAARIEAGGAQDRPGGAALAVLALLATRRGQGGDRRTRGTWTQRIKLAPKRRVARVVALLAYICSENEPLDETAWAAAPSDGGGARHTPGAQVLAVLALLTPLSQSVVALLECRRITRVL